MKITKVNLEGHELVVYYIIDNYYLGLFLKNGPLRVQGSWPISFISDKTNLTGENGILEIIEGIKNVTGTKAEFQKLVDSEPYDLTDGSREELDNWYKAGKTRIWDWYTNDPEDFLIPMPEEYKGKLPYKWSGGEIGWAESYSDITVCFDNFSDREEYYKTSEVLEVLEKWKEALEKWNNPDEKKKMIEEYEKKKEKED